MRINVYSEEITERVEVKRRQATNTGAWFYGLHFFLRSPEELHHSNTDDDTSAVILWSDTPEKLRTLLSAAAEEVQRFIESK